MAESHLLINIDDLCLPISGEFPAGVKLPPQEREKLDKLRKDHNPEDYADDDPLRHEPRQTADWSAIIDLTQKLLKTTSKDLNLASRLLEALTRQHGFPGVRDGFQLLLKLCHDGWNRLHPFPEIADMDEAESRLRDFRWLDDPESDMRGARFPHTIKSIPIARSGDVIVSVLNCRATGNKPPLINSDQMRFVAGAMDKETADSNLQAIKESLQSLQSLITACSDGLCNDLKRLGHEESKAKKLADDFTPAFTETRKALEEGKLIIELMLKEKASGATGTGEMPVGSSVTAGGTSAGPASAAANREQLYLQLKQIADQLEKIDPHSPVPFLLRRAVELRTLKFPDLVSVLTRGTHVLDFMKSSVEEQKG